jgi:hypothetical protein
VSRSTSNVPCPECAALLLRTEGQVGLMVTVTYDCGACDFTDTTYFDTEEPACE